MDEKGELKSWLLKGRSEESLDSPLYKEDSQTHGKCSLLGGRPVHIKAAIQPGAQCTIFAMILTSETNFCEL